MTPTRNVLLLLLAILIAEGSPAQPTEPATYDVVFESTWSALSHPEGFPSGPHFSGLIGVTHHDGVTFWMPGGLASDGIESMAETGSKSALTAEIQTAIDAGTAGFLLSGGGIGLSPGSRSMLFEISPDKPLVTLVSMLAPSPDWFVGVHGLNMIDGDAWRDSITVSLDVYDAGTDNGTMYMSANSNTSPAQPIAILNTGSFAQNQTVGSFTFTRREVVSTSEEQPGAWEVIGPYPNPASDRFTIDVTGTVTRPIRVQLVDVTGRAMREVVSIQRNGRGGIDIDVSRVPKGVYIVRVVGSDQALTRTVAIL